MATRAELFELAHQLGHTDPQLFENGRGFWVTCSCGYRSTTKRTEVDALGSGVHHVLTIARAAEAKARLSGRRIDVGMHKQAS